MQAGSELVRERTRARDCDGKSLLCFRRRRRRRIIIIIMAIMIIIICTDRS